MTVRVKWVTSMLVMIALAVIWLSGMTTFAHADTTYVVNRGDTLWDIARLHNTSVTTLKDANHLQSDVLHIHQTLHIPAATSKTRESSQALAVHHKPSSAQGQLLTYTVQRGDSLWSIANHNHTSIQAVMDINHLYSDVIQPGQKLKISTGATLASRASTIHLTKFSTKGIPEALIPVYKAAGQRYGIPWTVLAAIHRVETNFGTGYVASYAGAQGPMQFLPSTFRHYAVTAPQNHGAPDINNVYDAIYTCAHMLKVNGYAKSPFNAIYSYNHSARYVQTIQYFAQQFEV